MPSPTRPWFQANDRPARADTSSSAPSPSSSSGARVHEIEAGRSACGLRLPPILRIERVLPIRHRLDRHRAYKPLTLHFPVHQQATRPSARKSVQSFLGVARSDRCSRGLIILLESDSSEICMPMVPCSILHWKQLTNKYTELLIHSFEGHECGIRLHVCGNNFPPTGPWVDISV